MNDLIFPKATEDLLFAIQEHRDDLAPTIDAFLKQFSVTCAQAFLTSLMPNSRLFDEEDLLERMRRYQS